MATGSDAYAGTPKIFLFRHGETEWSKNGRYTGTSELELLPSGEQQVADTGRIVVGAGKLIDPKKVGHVFSSPRRRAVKTFELVFGEETVKDLKAQGRFTATEKLGEWGYGAYEGLQDIEIRNRRKEQGLDKNGPWDIWRDGCEDGESPADVTKRLDSLIEDIHAVQAPYMHSERPADVVLFCHGHISRAFVKRWLQLPMEIGIPMHLDPGGVGVLSYKGHDMSKPILHIGIGFPTESESA